MNYVIQINNSPNFSSNGEIAYQFIKAAIAKNHRIRQVFFYREGIYHALKYALPPDDEWNMTRRWSELAEQYEIDLLVCISAAQRRGLLSRDEAQRQGKQDDDLAPGFKIGGLGQFMEAVIQADRLIEFG